MITPKPIDNIYSPMGNTLLDYEFDKNNREKMSIIRKELTLLRLPRLVFDLRFYHIVRKLRIINEY